MWDSLAHTHTVRVRYISPVVCVYLRVGVRFSAVCMRVCVVDGGGGWGLDDICDTMHTQHTHNTHTHDIHTHTHTHTHSTQARADDRAFVSWVEANPYGLVRL